MSRLRFIAPCECGHAQASHNALKFNCLATRDGTHSSRCDCRTFVPSRPDTVDDVGQVCDCGTLPPHLHRRGCFVFRPLALPPTEEQ